jgi:hypothetical protein
VVCCIQCAVCKTIIPTHIVGLNHGEQAGRDMGGRDVFGTRSFCNPAQDQDPSTWVYEDPSFVCHARFFLVQFCKFHFCIIMPLLFNLSAPIYLKEGKHTHYHICTPEINLTPHNSNSYWAPINNSFLAKKFKTPATCTKFN